MEHRDGEAPVDFDVEVRGPIITGATVQSKLESLFLIEMSIPAEGRQCHLKAKRANPHLPELLELECLLRLVL